MKSQFTIYFSLISLPAKYICVSVFLVTAFVLSAIGIVAALVSFTLSGAEREECG